MSFSDFNVDMPVRFSSGGHFVSDGEWTHPTRLIDTYEVILGLRGEAYIHLENTRRCVHAGEIMLLPANRLHGGYQASREVSFFWFHFYPNAGQAVVSKYPDSAYPILSEGNAAHIPYFFSALAPGKLSVLSTQLLDIYESKYANTQYQDHFMTVLLLEISQQYARCMSRLDDRAHRSLYNICEWIRVHSEDVISLEGIAEQFGYNKNYLCRLFKSHLNITVQEYINRLKISNVKQYLCTGNKSVKEIAFLVGFSDEKYMMRLFKSMEAITPTQFRRAYDRTHMNRQ